MNTTQTTTAIIKEARNAIAHFSTVDEKNDPQGHEEAERWLSESDDKVLSLRPQTPEEMSEWLEIMHQEYVSASDNGTAYCGAIAYALKQSAELLAKVGYSRK